MKWLSIPVALTLLVLGSACGEIVTGSGNIETRTIEASDFTRVTVCCGYHVELTQGADEGVEITGDDNIIADIVARRDGSTLDLEYGDRSASYQPTQPIEIAITVEQLRSFAGSGGSELFAAELRGDDFVLVMSGGGSAHIDGGEVTRQDISLSGGSVYKAANLKSKRVDLDMSGGSQATVWATDSLDVAASGGSQLRYKGDPASTNFQLSGGSTVQKAE